MSPDSAPNEAAEALTPANYHPTFWADDDFVALKSEDVAVEASMVGFQHEELKKEVRKMLSTDAVTMGQKTRKLRLIDAVQRLGVSYHLESEIEAELSNTMKSGVDELVANDLESAALWFRLLRQQGFRVSPDILENFKDGEGNFKQTLVSDVPAMLSLYEASFLSIPGEAILDQAMAFTTRNLTGTSSSEAEEVSSALFRPIRKRLQRLEARQFIDAYRTGDESHDDGALLRFAQLDFNILQRIHQEELRGIKQWWEGLDVPMNFPYARDRIVECYFWIMGVYFEPKYCLGRTLLTKFLAIMSLADDTYDNYATAEQLDVFTQAIERWDINLVRELPRCMKMLYSLFVYIFNKFEDAVSKEGRFFAPRYAKMALDRTLKAYLTEAKWRDANYFPTLEEYMQVSLVTTCYPLLIAVSFLGMSGADAATEDTFEWLSGDPDVLTASTTVCRLMDDIVSHKLEQERKHIPSAVECYMEKHGVTEEAVVELFRERVAEAWKELNKGCLMRPTAVAAALMDRILNFTRAMDVIYKVEDGYTNSYALKDCVASILKEPIFVNGV